MTITSPYFHPDKKVFYLLCLLTLLQLLVALLTFDHALGFDESIWHYIGHNWFRRGIIPYKSGIDNKSPLIFIIYGLSDALFGVNYWFPRVVGTLCQSVGIFFLYKIAVHLAGRRAGILVMTLYGLSLLWYGTGGKFVSLTETYAVTGTIIALYYFLHAESSARYFYFSGLAAGLAIAFRLTALAGAGTIFLFSFRSGGRSSALFALGVLSCLAILVTGFVLAGIPLRDLYVYCFADNFLQHSITDHSFEWRLDSFINGFFHSELILFYPLLIGYFMIKRRLDLVALWLIIGCFCIYKIGMYATQHFKDILPPLSLAGALCIDHVLTKVELSFRKCLAVIWLCFFPKLSEPIAYIRRLWHPTVDEPLAYCQPPYSPLDNFSRKKLGKWIKDNTGFQDKVLVAGFGSQILVYTERVSASIYFNTPETEKGRTSFYREVNENKPALVAVPLGSDYRQLVQEEVRSYIRDLVSGSYRLDTCLYGYNIYRINTGR
jgi:4-amino-4-deoxy-L-arabinose transferase-like glycosyltransferase